MNALIVIVPMSLIAAGALACWLSVRLAGTCGDTK